MRGCLSHTQAEQVVVAAAIPTQSPSTLVPSRDLAAYITPPSTPATAHGAPTGSPRPSQKRALECFCTPTSSQHPLLSHPVQLDPRRAHQLHPIPWAAEHMATRSSWRCVSTMCSEPAWVPSISAPIELPPPSLSLPQAKSTPLCLFTLTPPLTSPPLGHYTPFIPYSPILGSENANYLTIPSPEVPRCTPHSRTAPRHRRQRSRPNIPISFYSTASPTPPIPAFTSPIESKPLGLNRGSAVNFASHRQASSIVSSVPHLKSLDFICNLTALTSPQTGMLVSSNHNHHHQHHHASSPYSQMHGFEAGASSSASSSSHISTSNGRSRGHAHSAPSDSGSRPRSASSSDSTASSSRSGPHVIRSQHASSSKGSPSSSQDSLLTDEQRLSILRQQQAQRRPKMLRLTPAIHSLTGASRSLSATMAPLATSLDGRQGQSSRPASVVGITSLVGDYSSSSLRQSMLPDGDVESPPEAGLTILIDPKKATANGQGEDVKVQFPVVGSPPNSYHPPLHPGSRKALAQKASLQPANGAALQLDLGCITGPSVSDHSSAASANSAATLPELVRKKSGEPVKSSLKHFTQSAFLQHRSDSSPAAPASFRAKSVPNTPTSSKAVHFDPVLEHIKVFKHKQRPTAVSRDGSPEHTETETEEEREFPFYQNWRKHAVSISSPGGASNGSAASTPTGDIGAAEQLVLRLPNFPSSAKMSVDRKVFLERAYLSDDLRSVKGTVQVQNLAFEKWVAIRFTLDNWATVCEVSAEHSESIKGGKSDRFTFSIKLNELLIWTRGQSETKTMFLCIRFTAAGQEYWDNNEDGNYQLDFRKRLAPETEASGSKTRAESPSSAGRSHSRKVHSPNSSSAEFGSRKVHSPKHFQAEELGRSLERLRSDDDAELGDEQVPLPVRNKRRSPPSSPGVAANGRSSSPSMWTARYDFDLSLKNPKTGSRTTNAGRQAALDYFSARPPPPSTALGRPVFIGNSPQVSPAHVEGDVFSPSVDSQGSMTPVALKSADSALAVPVGVFAPKRGMISPGLGDVIAHLPTSVNTGSATPSPSSGFNSAANSPAAEYGSDVLEVGTVEQPAVIAVVTRSSPDTRTPTSTKFHSYPLNRHTLSPMASAQLQRNPRTLQERVSSPLSRQSTVTGHSGRESPVKKDRSNGVLLTSSFVAESPQHSPVSPLHSPNPFSPSLSVSSLESDNTTCLASPEDTVLGSSLGSSRRSTDIRTPGSVEDIHRSLLGMGRVGLPNGSSLPSTPEGNTSQAAPGSPTLSTTSTSDSASTSSSMKPGSVSSYDELIARFCWNDSSNSQGDTTVTSATASSGVPESSTALPSNGHASTPTSMNIPHLPHRAFANSMGSPTTESGSTTPTIGF